MNFNEKLRFWIVQKYGSIKKFANILGIHYTTVHSYVSGHREPNIQFLNKIKDLGCDMNWLLEDNIGTEEYLVKEKSPPYKSDRIKELEEENARLRESIGRILSITQAEIEKKHKKGSDKKKK